MPELRGFNFVATDAGAGVFRATDRLVTYTSAFIAEIVRAGIQAVPEDNGMRQCTRLRRSFVLQRIVLPQALRVSIRR